ncbi:MAG: response regulator [Acetobacteraceae bacterium]|nr:response regulator [Acetobacteraceae bacterium]
MVKARQPHLSVFMIAAYGDSNNVETALSRGASKFLTKLVEFSQLEQGVLQAVAHARGN